MLQDMFPQSVSITPADPKLRSEDTLGGETFNNSPTQSNASNMTDLTSNNITGSPPQTPNHCPQQQFPDEMLDYFDFMQNEVPLSLSSQEGHNILPSFYLDRSSSVANRSLSDKDKDRLETISSNNSHLTSSPVSHTKTVTSPVPLHPVSHSPISHRVISPLSSNRINSSPNLNFNSNFNLNSSSNSISNVSIFNPITKKTSASSTQTHTVSGPISVKKIPVNFQSQLPALSSQIPTPSALTQRQAPKSRQQHQQQQPHRPSSQSPQLSQHHQQYHVKPEQASIVTGSTLSSDDKLVNSLSKLRRLNSSIAIELTMTKDYPEFGQPLNKESLLHEYHPGELITGSIQIQNTSKRPIKYELVMGTFEGYVTIPVRNNRHSKEIIKRQFLRIVDPGASSHQYHIPNSNVKTPSISSFDESDGTEYGLTNDKILESGKKYKQFFQFKIPEALFDDTCSHSLPEHKNKLPPSLGLDTKASVNGDIASDEVYLNKALGYGRCEIPGSPILMNDQAHKGYSISYCMHISVISIENYSDLNPGYNILPSQNQEYCMLNDKKHYIRCVSTNKDYNFSSHLGLNEQVTGVQIKELENKCLKEKERLRSGNSIINNNNNRKVAPSRENSELIDLNSELVDLDSYSSITSISDGDSRNFSKRDEISSDEDSTRMFDIKSTANEFQSEMVVPLKPKKKLLKFGSSKLSSRIGTLGAKCTISKDARIPYVVPRTLKKYSTDKSLDEQSKLYDSICTKTVTLSILFKPYSSQSNPPETITIKPLLKSILLSSPFPIPITFSSKSLSRGGEFTKPRLLSIQNTFLQNLRDMKAISNRTRRGVDKKLFYDINSIAQIKRSDDKLPIFKYQTIKPNWKTYHSSSTDSHNNKLNYVCNVEIPLEYNELITKNLTVLPNFDSCYFVKRYFLSFGFDLKGYYVGRGVELTNGHNSNVNGDVLGFVDKDALDVPINVVAL